MKRPEEAIKTLGKQMLPMTLNFMCWVEVLQYIGYLETKTSTPDVHTNIITPPSRL